MNTLHARATNPWQYDLEDVTWSEETAESPTRKFFFHYVNQYRVSWQHASILDIGAGTGWLMQLLEKNGAKSVIGIEPSAKSVAVSKKHYPSLQLHNVDLEHFTTKQQFDLIISVMAFNHIADIRSAFQKISGWLKKTGEFQLIIPDFEYSKTPRFDYNLTIIPLNEHEYLEETNRHEGVIANIMRTVTFYETVAKNAGLRLVEDIPLVPTQELMNSRPKYKDFAGKAICRLLRFRF